MDQVGRLAKALKGKPQHSPFVYGIWLAAESTDANLSKVLVPGAGLGGEDITLRFVPRAKHVTGLTTSSTVLLAGNPLCIIADIIGDITTAAI